MYLNCTIWWCDVDTSSEIVTTTKLINTSLPSDSYPLHFSLPSSFPFPSPSLPFLLLSGYGVRTLKIYLPSTFQIQIHHEVILTEVTLLHIRSLELTYFTYQKICFYWPPYPHFFLLLAGGNHDYTLCFCTDEIMQCFSFCFWYFP